MGNVRIPSLEALSQRIVNDVQPSRDDGIFGFVFNDILAKNHSNIVSDLLSHLRSKGHYEIAMFFGIFWCVCIPVLALIFIFWSCHLSRTCCCRTNTKIQRVWTTILSTVYLRFFKNSKDPYAMRNFGKSSIRMKNRPSGRSMTTLLVLTALVLSFFFSGLMVAYAANNPLQWTIDSRQPPSLKATVNSSINDFRSFVVNGIDHGSSLTSTVMNKFSAELTVTVKRAVQQFTDRLLSNYGVNNLFDKATKVIGDIQNVLTAMKFIDKSQISVFTKLNEFKGYINTIRDQLNDIAKLCALNQPAVMKQQCQNLKSQQLRLVVNIDQSKVNFESSTSLLFLLREMSLNISSLATQMNTARSAIDKMLSTVYVSIQKDFNLDSILGSVNGIWDTATNFTNSYVLQSLDRIQENGTISAQINMVSSARKVGLGMISFFFFLFLVSVLALMVMIISIHFSRNKRRKYLQQESVSNTDSTTADTSNYSRFIPKRFETKVPVNVFNCYFLFMGFLVIVPMALVVGSFLIGSVIENEGCRYMTTKSGLQRIDSLVNGYLTDNWNELTGSLNLSFAGIQVTLQQPKNLVEAISDTCANSSRGLLDKVGLKNLLDIDALVKSDMFTTMINSGKGFAKKTIAGLDAKSMIPSSMAPLLKEATNLTKLLVDNIQYQRSIQELRKPLLQVSNLTKFIIDLDDYVKKIKALYPSNSYISLVEIILPTLHGKNSEYVELVKSLQEVLKNFILLQETRTISKGLNGLIILFNDVKLVLSNSTRLVSAVDPIYDQVMVTTKKNITEVLKQSVKTLENELLPCSSLQNAFSTATETVCQVFLPEFNAFTMAYGWSLLWFQIIFILLWVLLMKVRRQQEPLYSEC